MSDPAPRWIVARFLPFSDALPTRRPRPAGPRRAQSIVRALTALILLLALVPCLVPGPGGSLLAQGTDPAESRAFRQAMNAFSDGLHERAEREFSRFIATYPQSPMIPEATLLQAQAALRQTNAPRAIAVITAGLPKAGLLQDQYRYWLGNAYLESRNFTAAADTFAAIPKAMTNSSLLLEAGYGEALARFRLGHHAAVIPLLSDPAGSFQRGSQTRPNDEITIRGRMLLAEAHFRLGQYADAEKSLQTVPSATLLPETRWERQYLLCRLLVAANRLTEALVASSNLVAIATPAVSRTLAADSHLFQGGLLRQLDRLDEAAAAYTNNIDDSVPADQRRLSLLHLIELKLAQDRLPEAVAMLDAYLARRPDDAAAEVLLLTRGEIELKAFLASRATNAVPGSAAPPAAPGPSVGTPATTANATSPNDATPAPAANPPPRPDAAPAATGASPAAPGTAAVLSSLSATNPLPSILARFEALLATNTSGPLRGKAFLNKGWCLWLEGRIAESAVAFAAATQTLPRSEDLATARFKLGDALLAQKDYTNAIAQFRALTNEFAAVPAVRDALFDQALYQLLQASIALGDEPGATATVRVLLENHAGSTLVDRGLFLVGQELMKRGKPAEARARLTEFARRFPNSPLRADAELVVARTYLQEGLWSQALTDYDRWLTTFPTNELRPRAEFNRAWAAYRAGQETNAHALFTNFVARYESDTRLAPMAQYWIAEHHLRQGQYREAIGAFQRILENTNWPVTHRTYEARLMAGRAAFAAQLWKDAAGEKGHFAVLLSDENCPPDIAAQASFAFGDTLLSWDLPQTRPIDKYKEAKDAFSRIPLRYTNSPLVAAAWGKVGECHLQMASQDPRQYAEATNAFLRAMTNATASVSVRSQAEFGLARALELYGPTLTPAEAAGFQKAAFDHYYNVVIGANLRDGETPDPFWLEKAGLEAARIAEAQNQWTMAINLYERMQRLLEPIRPRLEERIRRVQELARRDRR